MKKKLEKIRHSLAHVLAWAVKEIFPEAKLGIGPATETGFYYDFDFEKPISKEDLPKIEQKMRELLEKNVDFVKKEISKKEAEKIFEKEPFKLELLKEIEGDKVSVYFCGNFFDLCKGPHVKNTREIPKDAFCLSKISGAYWKGDEKNKMLTRIYGFCFESKKELENYLKTKEELQKRDHRVLGEKLELFLFDEEVGSGLPIWLPKGTILRKIIEDFLFEELKKEGYFLVVTPHIGKLQLWQTSGHWELYRENIYSPIEIDKEYFLLKPMNCPFHVKVFKSKTRSFRNLPFKIAEFGTVYRYERSGTLHGLTRARGFTQDDAHVFCQKEQLFDEVQKLLRHGLKILKIFGFKDFGVYLSTRPEKFAGTEKMWQKATSCLKKVLKKEGIKYQIDPGGGVFYGPKIDIKIKDCFQREWQCTTIQVDFNLPERFDINFVNQKGKKERVVLVHRALVGSLERFIGVLIEHYGGAFPLWLAPEQVWVVPVTLKHQKYAKKIVKELLNWELRAHLKDEKETVSKKIREAEIQKIPYVLVVGDKEMKNKTVSVRQRKKGDLGQMRLEKFLEKVKKEIKNKK